MSAMLKLYSGLSQLDPKGQVNNVTVFIAKEFLPFPDNTLFIGIGQGMAETY